MNINIEIKEKLHSFIKQNRIPHLMFYGDYGSGKRSLVTYFLDKMYNNTQNEDRMNYIMNINCGYGKGIKFIREDIKFFAKTNINCRNGLFKTIILYNADKLTMDAQSALRRCIEEFSHSTRFIITAHDKNKILKPILSRFCNIFVANPIDSKTFDNINLHNKSQIIQKTNNNPYIKKQLNNLETIMCPGEIIKISEKLYNKGISGIDILNYIESMKNIENNFRYELLFHLKSSKKDFRCEKMFLMFSLYCLITFNCTIS